MAEFVKDNNGTRSMVRVKRIIADITKYIDKYGGEYSDWRIGLRKSSRQRFLDMQFVMFKSHLGIIRQSASVSEAKKILNYFVEKCRLALDIPEIECEGDMVYVYKDSTVLAQSSRPRQLTLFSDIFGEIKSRGGSKYKSLPESDSTDEVGHAEKAWPSGEKE
jgi:hypothetical protein